MDNIKNDIKEKYHINVVRNIQFFKLSNLEPVHFLAESEFYLLYKHLLFYLLALTVPKVYDFLLILLNCTDSRRIGLRQTNYNNE